MLETNPDFANELNLPNSENRILEKERLYYWGDYQEDDFNIDRTFFTSWYRGLLDISKRKNIRALSVINSAVAFDPNYNQRPLNLAKHLAHENHLVLFITWQWEPEERLENSYKEVYPNIFEVPMYKFIGSFSIFLNLLFNSVEWENRNFIVTLPSKHFLRLISQFRKTSTNIIYDIMDEWEEFNKMGQAPWFIKDVEEAFILAADSIYGVAPSLIRKFSYLRNDILVNGNGYSVDALKKENKLIALKNTNKIIKVGYFGHLTEAWFDWDLVFSIAKSNPKIIFEIIGYGCSDQTLETIKKHKNIKFLGKKKHHELISYSKYWYAGLIPFKKSILSEAVDPIKIYEYLYFGIPSITSGIPHLKDYPHTWVIEDPKEFNEIFPQLQKSRSKMAKDKELALFLEESKWESRFNSLLSNAKSSSVFSNLVE